MRLQTNGKISHFYGSGVLRIIYCTNQRPRSLSLLQLFWWKKLKETSLKSSVYYFLVRISWRSFSRRARPWVWQERRSLVEPEPRRRGRWRDPVNKMQRQQTEAPQTMWVPVPSARLPSHRRTPSHTTVSLCGALSCIQVSAMVSYLIQAEISSEWINARSNYTHTHKKLPACG